jgi:hypothetical protein
MPGRQPQIKQIWFNPTDDENIQVIADYLAAQGIDVEPDHRKAKDKFSHTKVVRYALQKLADELRRDEKGSED